jgi:hypothetical protein
MTQQKRRDQEEEHNKEEEKRADEEEGVKGGLAAAPICRWRKRHDHHSAQGCGEALKRRP